jgi:hypothetical protein
MIVKYKLGRTWRWSWPVLTRCSTIYTEGWANHYEMKSHLDKGEKKEVKSIPLQPWTGPEGSRRLRLPDFKTFGT